jgi:hypothetical protein
MRSSERAWVALVAGVVAYEIYAEDGELLSHQVDRWLEEHPILTWTVTVFTAAHLLNVLHPYVDPFAWVFKLGKWRN